MDGSPSPNRRLRHFGTGIDPNVPVGFGATSGFAGTFGLVEVGDGAKTPVQDSWLTGDASK
jgi:hypothetical protein